MRARPMAVAILAVLLSWNGPAAAQDEAVGTWSGWGFEVSATGKFGSWTIRVRIEPGGNGTIEYPSLGCGGTLTLLQRSGPTIEYRERITQGAGACVDSGTVGLRTKSGKLLWYWTGEDTNQPEGAASAVLFRVSNW